MIKKYFYLVLLLLTAVNIEVNAAASDFSKTYYDLLALFIILIIVLVFGGFIYFGMGEGKPTKERTGLSLFARFRQLITASTPIEKEGDILLDHDYDGIRELDNRIPPWFTYLFYITIIFAVYYMLDYHIFKTGILQDEEYAMEIQAADAQRAELIKSGAFINEETVTLLNDEASLLSGKSIYISNCIACHREDGGGLIGPNLTDEFWIHGGDVKNVFKIIKYGVPAKGMISWQTQLNPKQMQEVMSFILSLQGTTPQNPKAPEGDKFSPETDSVKTVAFN